MPATLPQTSPQQEQRAINFSRLYTLQSSPPTPPASNTMATYVASKHFRFHGSMFVRIGAKEELFKFDDYRAALEIIHPE